MDGDAQQPAEAGRADGPDGQRRFVAMAVLVALDLVFGLVAIITVPFSRPSAWIPASGRAIYVLHAVLGAVLAVGSVWLLLGARGEGRVRRGAASIGLAGIALGGVGGIVAVYHPVRLLGMALMFLGSVVAGMAYLAPGLTSSSPSGLP